MVEPVRRHSQDKCLRELGYVLDKIFCRSRKKWLLRARIRPRWNAISCNLDRTRPLRSRIGYFLRSERHSLGYVLQVERSTSVTDSLSNQVETEPPEAVTGRWQLIVVAVAFVSHDRIIHRRRFCPNFFLERYHKSFSAMGNAKTIADPKTVDIRRVLHGPF
jgi:hypothetical protein